jgi:hypothetical protein
MAVSSFTVRLNIGNNTGIHILPGRKSANNPLRLLKEYVKGILYYSHAMRGEKIVK